MGLAHVRRERVPVNEDPEGRPALKPGSGVGNGKRIGRLGPYRHKVTYER
jgi:hypothetical protein